MSRFHSTPEWIALSKQHKAIERAYKRWRCKDCGYTGKAMESDHELSVKNWPMAKLWLCNLSLRCGPEAKGCNQKKGVQLYYTPRTAKLLFYYGVIMILKLLPWAIIVLALVIDQSRGPWDTTIAYQIAGPIIEYFLLGLDKTLDAVAAWLSSRSE